MSAVSAYVTAAFPGAHPEPCPAASACWLAGPRELAVARDGRATAFGSGADGELIAAILSRSQNLKLN